MHQDFDSILDEIWKDIPNGNIYKAISKDMSTTSIDEEQLRHLDSIALQKVLPLLDQEEIKNDDLVFLQALENDLILLIELVMVFVTSNHTAFDHRFQQALENRMKELFNEYAYSDHYEVARELADLLFRYFKLPIHEDLERQEYYLKIHVAITTRHMIYYPNLIGASVVKYGNWLLSQGEKEEADKMYQNVILDLEYLIERVDDPDLPQAEKMTALWWLKEAYLHRSDLHPTNTALTQKAQLVKQLLEDRDVSSIPLSIRTGKIIGAYKTKDELLILIIRDIMNSSAEQDQIIREIVYKYGINTDDALFYISAIGSYSAKKFLNQAGVKATYDQEFERVFAAIKALKK